MDLFEQESSLNPSPVVYLYELDFAGTKLGITDKLYWTPYRNGTSNIVFDGQTYAYMGVRLEGLDMELGGKLPSPALKIFTPIADPFYFKALTADVRGLKVTRIKTHANFLDGAANADPDQCKKVYFYVNGLQMRVGSNMTFKLSTNYGLEGLNNKANRVLNTFSCINKYRVWNGTDFNYTPVEDGGCPWGNPAYAATWGEGITDWGASFDGSDEPAATPAQDRCSLTAKGCMVRFAAEDNTHPIPYTADPKGTTKGPGGCSK